ncbi:MAG: hypothetical protein FWG63_01825 [Defluviitaleaceae bacterium]|nr:hypothetical protein [Defluviitaleaceae bacterium]
MYIETRFYDKGICKARLHKTHTVIETSDKYDAYLEKFNITLEDWLYYELVGVETDDIIPFVLILEAGEWLDITAYC